MESNGTNQSKPEISLLAATLVLQSLPGTQWARDTTLKHVYQLALDRHTEDALEAFAELATNIAKLASGFKYDENDTEDSARKYWNRCLSMCMRHVRDTRSQPKRVATPDALAALVASADLDSHDTPDPVDAIDAKRQMEELLRACAESSPVKHAILLDHLKHGDTICDTAERLGLSHECAHVHMFHLRQKVRSEFGVAWGYMTQSEANGARDTKRSRRK